MGSLALKLWSRRVEAPSSSMSAIRSVAQYRFDSNVEAHSPPVPMIITPSYWMRGNSATFEGTPQFGPCAVSVMLESRFVTCALQYSY